MTSPLLVDILPSDSPFIALAKTLEDCEAKEYWDGDSEPFAYFHASMLNQSNCATGEVKQRIITVQVLLAYRVLDVFATLGRIGAATCERGYIPPCGPMKPEVPLNDLGGWAKTAIALLEDNLEHDVNLFSEPVPTIDTALCILDHLSRSQAKGKSLTLVNNLLRAAFHLNHFLKTLQLNRIRQDYDVYPADNGDTGDGQSELEQPVQDLSVSDQRTIKREIKVCSSKMQHALTLALAWSPIVIAVSRNCQSAPAFSRIVHGWTALEGLEKSDSLCSIENTLWMFLLHLATTNDIRREFRALVSKLVPFSELKKDAWLEVKGIETAATCGDPEFAAEFACGDPLDSRVTDAEKEFALNLLSAMGKEDGRFASFHGTPGHRPSADAHFASSLFSGLRSSTASTTSSAPSSTLCVTPQMLSRHSSQEGDLVSGTVNVASHFSSLHIRQGTPDTAAETLPAIPKLSLLSFPLQELSAQNAAGSDTRVGQGNLNSFPATQVLTNEHSVYHDMSEPGPPPLSSTEVLPAVDSPRSPHATGDLTTEMAPNETASSGNQTGTIEPRNQCASQPGLPDFLSAPVANESPRTPHVTGDLTVENGAPNETAVAPEVPSGCTDPSDDLTETIGAQNETASQSGVPDVAPASDSALLPRNDFTTEMAPNETASSDNQTGTIEPRNQCASQPGLPDFLSAPVANESPRTPHVTGDLTVENGAPNETAVAPEVPSGCTDPSDDLTETNGAQNETASQSGVPDVAPASDSGLLPRNDCPRSPEASGQLATEIVAPHPKVPEPPSGAKKRRADDNEGRAKKKRRQPPRPLLDADAALVLALSMTAFQIEKRIEVQCENNRLDEDENDIWDSACDNQTIHDFAICSFHDLQSDVAYEWKPFFKYGSQHEWFLHLTEAASATCSAGEPRYVHNPSVSNFKILQRKEFSALSTPEALCVLRNQSVVVVGDDSVVAELDLSSLQNLGSVESAITFQGTDMRSGQPRIVQGTAINFWQNLTSANARVLRSFPVPLTCDPSQNGAWDVDKIASEKWAWKDVKGNWFCPRNQAYPVGDMRWAQCSMKGSYSAWHIVPNGFGVLMQVDVGVELVFTLTPKENGPSILDAAWRNFDSLQSNLHNYDVEVVVLKAGCQFVLGQSMEGIYHSFLAGAKLSHGHHEDTSSALLTHIMALYHRNITLDLPRGMPSRSMDHVPDVTKWDDFVVILSLCVFFELQTATSEWVYGARMSPVEWRRSMQNRKLAREIMRWIFTHHSFTNSKGETLQGHSARDTIYYRTIAATGLALREGKRLADRVGVDGPFQAPFRKVKQAIDLCMQHSPTWLIFAGMRTRDASLLYGGERYAIQKCSAMVVVYVADIPNTDNGANAFDMILVRRFHYRVDVPESCTTDEEYYEEQSDEE
ncbi:hypothetical protein H0H93_006534 [Arthromyces matolae]|nr:hypothetical protein H0H93_006534 [Arthromyces matolae]